MTTGQRIAAKRKEQNLSQEALGEALGVSRQSIYKWESDSSLPEIDKLIALSRLFGVPVGWLLGVEEEAEPSSCGSGEWTDAQLTMLEELLKRYQQASQEGLSQEQQAQVEALVSEQLAAQTTPRKHRYWPYLVAVLALVWAGMNLFDKLEQMDDRYNSLSNSINNVSYDVNNQISGIANRVEEILKSQNDLTADYDTEYVAVDLARNTITFSARVVPKTYVEGMEVVFLVDSGDGPAEFPANQGPGREFTAELTCELTDHITLSAVFIQGDTRQTQLLDVYEGLYVASLPYVEFNGMESIFLHDVIQENGLFHLPGGTGWLGCMETGTEFGQVKIESYQVGLFKNFELVTWLEPCEKPENWDSRADQYYRFEEMDLALEQGDILHFAVIFTDQYGRQGATPSLPFFECFGSQVSWPDTDDASYFDEIDRYTF